MGTFTFRGEGGYTSMSCDNDIRKPLDGFEICSLGQWVVQAKIPHIGGMNIFSETKNWTACNQFSFWIR